MSGDNQLQDGQRKDYGEWDNQLQDGQRKDYGEWDNSAGRTEEGLR